MSIIGPRPALWNQDDLVAERDKYGANDILPGLTGFAQINGRDELEIAEKAKLDGEYAEKLKQGGMKALFFDAKCFLRTFFSVLRRDGVVEGGTGELHRNGEKAAVCGNTNIFRTQINGESAGAEGIEKVSAEDAGFKDYGYLKHFDIDISENNKKRVLITGAGSYVGESFEKWAKRHYPANFTIDTLDMQREGWREKDFSGYDAVFHVAGIAHADVGKVSEEEKKRYYAVNTDLAMETAKKAKAEGVKQFVFMSSMIVYGDSVPYRKEKVIDEKTVPQPSNFYGDSKWQADKGVRKLADGTFRVAILRPPMIYGKGSKGNYPVLAKLAKKLPVFPDVENRRSMLYIDNLCEFLCKLMLSGEGGIYFPQNKEYTKTAEMVKLISKAAQCQSRQDRIRKTVSYRVAGTQIWITKLLKPVVVIGSYVPGRVSGLVNKAFGNSCYSQRISEYEGLGYQTVGLKESVERTEGADTVLNFEIFASKTGIRQKGAYTEEACKQNKTEEDRRVHILVVSQYFHPETFRINDMACEWVKRGYKVTVLTGIPNYPMGKFYDGYGYTRRRRETWNGVDIIRIPLIPRGSSGNKLVNSLGMAANYFSFVASGWCWKVINDIGADIVFTCEVSPMTQALVGVWYAKKHRIPHFLYVQDLWPENVKTVAGIKNKTIIYSIDRMVDYIYRNTDQIFTTSKSFVDAIVNRKVKVGKEKVHYWPQYAEEFYKPLKREDVRETAERGSPVWLIPDDDSFKIAFTGNIGTAQGLNILPKVAERLKELSVKKKIRFVIVGDGRYQKSLEEEIRRRNVADSFIMIPRQKPEEIPKLLACCDAAFLSFSDTPLWEKTIPAKLQSYMACGMLVIAAAGGETKKIIKEAGCGVCVPIGDVEELVSYVQDIVVLPLEEQEKLGNNGRSYCDRYFDKAVLMDEMNQYFNIEIRGVFVNLAQVAEE